MISLLPGLPWIWKTMEISMDFVISMDMVDTHLKVEYFKQEKNAYVIIYYQYNYQISIQIWSPNEFFRGKLVPS